MGEFFHWVFIKDKIWNKKIVVKKLLKFLNLFTGKRSEYHFTTTLRIMFIQYTMQTVFFPSINKNKKKNH